MQSIAELVARVAALEARMANMMRPGRVAEVDTAKQRVRLAIGKADDGGDLLSPWLPYAQEAGQTKAHIPPAVGQQMMLVSPGGDPGLGVAMKATWSNDLSSPSTSPSENVITLGGVTITMTGDSLVIAVGGATVTINEGAIALAVGESTIVVDGGAITMNAGTINLN